MEQPNRGIYLKAFGYGVLGAFLMSALLALARWSGLTQFNLSMFLGSFITQEFTVGTWVLGFVWHLINGGVFAVAYCSIFKASGGATTGKGTLLGFVHWLIYSLIMAVSSDFHPLIPSEIVEPGFFAINFGAFTAISGLVLHLIFGYIIGNGLEGKVFTHRKPRVTYGKRYA